jgi:hypothetical protein
MYRGIDWSNSSAQITRNFSVREVTYLPQWGMYHIPNEREMDNIIRLAQALQRIRDIYGRPMTITSWIRPTSVNPGKLDESRRRIIHDEYARRPDGLYAKNANYNAIIGGATGSYHISGLAVDISDDNRSLTNFLLNNQQLLENNNLWMEDERVADVWVHLDLGNRSMANRPSERRCIFWPGPGPEPVIQVVELNTQQLSGEHWHSQFPTSTNISDLVSPFRENVQDFVVALREAGATVTISATLRPRNRALLMRYSWQIVNGIIEPQNVPSIPGVNIIWAHNDLNGNYSRELSIQAARAMVNAYQIQNLRVAPAQNSRHISGLAIDMNITWINWPRNTPIYVTNKLGEAIEVPKTYTGNNFTADLNPVIIEIGRTYGVIKFHIPENDPPHWSDDGR